MKIDYVTISNMMIDDIVLYNGRTLMGTLGGAGPHALSGMRVWSKHLGIVASVGKDIPETHLDQIRNIGVDLEGLMIWKDWATRRAWQIIELDDRRFEITRMDPNRDANTLVNINKIPASYFHARGFHVHSDESKEYFYEVLTTLRRQNPSSKIVWEPTPFILPFDPPKMEIWLKLVDVFSPNMEEAKSITGLSDIEGMVKLLFKWGAHSIIIRNGNAGSLVYSSVDQGWRIPTIPTRVVNVTGAGNAYCGGLLVGLGEGLSLEEAALRGAVSASFELEQFGIRGGFRDKISRRANERLNLAKSMVEKL